MKGKAKAVTQAKNRKLTDLNDFERSSRCGQLHVRGDTRSGSTSRHLGRRSDGRQRGEERCGVQQVQRAGQVDSYQRVLQPAAAQLLALHCRSERDFAVIIY